MIVAAGVVFHVAPWATFLVLIGYWSFERLDQWLARRAKEKAIENELWGWETDPEDPESETKGQLTRVKLDGKDQIIVARVAELLRRIP